MGVAEGLLLAALLTAVCWLGVKYAPLVLLVAGFFLLMPDGKGDSLSSRQAWSRRDSTPGSTCTCSGV